jgi:hypothetical protein
MPDGRAAGLGRQLVPRAPGASIVIDTHATVAGLIQAARSQPDAIRASRAVEPLLASLRSRLAADGPEGGAAPVIRTWSPGGPRLGEPVEQTVARLSFRLDEIALAKRWGDATDVQRMVDLTVGELRQTALAGRPASLASGG